MPNEVDPDSDAPECVPLTVPAGVDQAALATRLVRPGTQVPDGFAPLSVPTARASTVVFPDLAAMRRRDGLATGQWRYGLHATPTSAELAQRIALLDGGRHTLLLPSGLAAISLVYFALLKPGDDVLIPDNVYQPSRDHAQWLADDFGINVRVYPPMIGAGMAALIRPTTRLIWIEAPGSVTMEVPDIPAIVAAAKARGVVTALDNTWAAGVCLRTFDLGVDIAMQALTKYPSGGSDLLMGSLTTVDDALHQRLQLTRMRMGWGVSADDCFLVLRSLPSLLTRLAAHEQGALQVALWLKEQTCIARVLHPAFADCPGHAHWQRDFSGATGLFSVIFDARHTAAQIDAFIEALRLFDIGFSWGGAHSLALPYDIPAMRLPGAWPPADWDVADTGVLVRFYIGLESADDLIADLRRAMQVFSAG